MVTGDQGATARSIARQVGILEDGADRAILTGGELEEMEAEDLDGRIEEVGVYSRVTPEHKLRIVESYERRGHVVAMTGDGVNDAPALKRAQIGVAMGIRGTQVAKEAADMVLQDDRMETIVTAVREGRVIFTNLRRFVMFLLSCNISEVFYVFLGSIVFPFVPLYPIQILFINLVTDVFPALALGMEPEAEDVMEHPPRSPGEGVLTKKHFRFIYGYGLILTIASMAAVAISYYGLDLVKNEAITVGFLSLSLGQLMHVLNLSEMKLRRGKAGIAGHEAVLGSMGLCILLVLAAVYLPGLSDALKTVHPGWKGWTIAILAALSPLAGPWFGGPFRLFLGKGR
jgi:Ca2+-transporting ATPase